MDPSQTVGLCVGCKAMFLIFSFLGRLEGIRMYDDAQTRAMVERVAKQGREAGIEKR